MIDCDTFSFQCSTLCPIGGNAKQNGIQNKASSSKRQLQYHSGAHVVDPVRWMNICNRREFGNSQLNRTLFVALV